MKAKEVIRLIQKDGWMFERQTGSHKIFKHPTKKGIVVVREHGKEDIEMGTLNSILKQAGLK
ncbi:MAG TPA: type II toxin-antitoxin system HicA family toxin [Hanamia sp.]|nr:type II toxin-antitoxin system HicA family toxin [Hanamia sp.]